MGMKKHFVQLDHLWFLSIATTSSNPEEDNFEWPAVKFALAEMLWLIMIIVISHDISAQANFTAGHSSCPFLDAL